MSAPVSSLSSYADAAPALQPIAVPAFLAVLGIALLSPYVQRLLGSRSPGAAQTIKATMWTLLAGAIILTIFRPGGFLPWSLLLLVPLVGLGTYTLAGGAAALMLFAPVIWWWFDVSWQRVAIFAVLGIAFAGLPRWLGRQPPHATRSRPGNGHLIAIAACGAGLALASGLLTGPLNSTASGQLAWHHWGAYLSPVQALLSGGVPYRDFPVQYGMGPTLLLAGVCGSNCWNGIYWATVITNMLQLAMLVLCAGMLTERLGRGMQILALAAILSAGLLWTAYPAFFASNMMTPSVSGMRFLPVTALVTHILFSERTGRQANGRGHLLWLACMLWCTETAAYGSIIWWPCLAMRNSQAAADRIALLRTITRVAGIGIGATGAAIAVMLVAYRLWFGTSLEASSFFAYVNHLPTALPINPIGPVWLALSGILVAGVLLFVLPPGRPARQIYVCLLTFVAAGSYFISRSHDNNILNLFPYFVLLLCSVAAALPEVSVEDGSAFLSGFVRVTLAAMLAFSGTFDTASWGQAAAEGKLLQIGNHPLVARFEARAGIENQIASADAIRALDAVRRETPDDILLLDELKVMVISAPGRGWTGANNLANTIPLPDDMVRRYIRRGAADYRRPGWIVFQNGPARQRADLFRAGYNVAEERTYGTYSAYRLVPR